MNQSAGKVTVLWVIRLEAHYRIQFVISLLTLLKHPDGLHNCYLTKLLTLQVVRIESRLMCTRSNQL